MFAWQPRHDLDDQRWHLTRRGETVSLCDVPVAGTRRYTRREPDQVDRQCGERCGECWAVLRTLRRTIREREMVA